MLNGPARAPAWPRSDFSIRLFACSSLLAHEVDESLRRLGRVILSASPAKRGTREARRTPPANPVGSFGRATRALRMTGSTPIPLRCSSLLAHEVDEPL